MPAVGGSISAINLDGRNFTVASDSDGQRSLGGSTNTVEPNGDNTARLIKTANTWKVTDLDVITDNFNGDGEFLQNLADGNDFFPVAVTYADGSIYNGTGQITDEPIYSSAKATTALGLAGGGKMVKQ